MSWTDHASNHAEAARKGWQTRKHGRVLMPSTAVMRSFSSKRRAQEYARSTGYRISRTGIGWFVHPQGWKFR